MAHCDYISIGTPVGAGFGSVFDISALHPFDGMRVILEQLIFARYISLANNNQKITEEITTKMAGAFVNLPSEIFTGNTALDETYQTAKTIIHSMLDSINNTWNGIVIVPNDLFSIFRMECQSPHVSNIYKCTITEDFLTVFAAWFMNTYDINRYPSKTLEECAVYVPSYRTMAAPINLNKAVSVVNSDFKIEGYDDHSFIVVTLEPRVMTGFNLETSNRGWGTDNALFNFFNSFDMSDRTVDEYIALVASFKLLNGNNMNQYKSLIQICYDLVTRSDKSHGLPSAGEEERFFEVIRDMVQSGRLKTLQNLQLFEELLLLLGKPDISKFFSADQTTTTGKAAKLFRSSILSEFIPDRFMINMEADTSDADAVSSDDDDLALDDDSTLGDDPINPSTEDTEPQTVIDPMKMLLEMSNKADDLSDYLFRDIVYKRLTAVINNPPLNMAPNDLMLIKQWRAYWLYLVSIQCLKDFLVRIGRISD